MATPTVYKSTDSSAPTMNGTAGSLITVLDAVLVNGYGSKAAAGWTKPYSGANLAVYRPGAGPQHYLDVTDTAATTSAIRGYETMTGTGTGTGPFPTTAQSASGRTITKSATADATARAWRVYADDRTMYLIAGGSTAVIVFGEFFSYLAGDNYRSILGADCMTLMNGGGAIVNGTGGASNMWCPRTYAGLSASSVWMAGFQNGTVQSSSATDLPSGQFPFPNPVDGGLHINRLGIVERGTASTISTTGNPPLRGRYRGVHQICHPASSFADGDTFDGAGEFTGKSFVIHKISTSGVFAVETTEWDTSA